MNAAVTFQVTCPFCDAVQTRDALDPNSKHVELTIDGDNQTLEYDVDCALCEFPVRGSVNHAKITIRPATKEDIT